jgi:membrane protease YdiL (CAAX protease family)
MTPEIERFGPLHMHEIFWNSRGRFRAGWLIVIYAALASVCMIGAVRGYEALMRLIAPGRSAAVNTGANIGFYFFLFLGVMVSAFLMIRFLHRSSFQALGFSFHDRIWVELLQGITQGALMISVIFLLECSAGWTNARWSGLQMFSLARFGINYTLLFAFAAAFEEALLRGYAFQMLVQGTGKTIAVLLSSLAFGAAHLSNPHASFLSFADTVLTGIWLSCAYLKTRSLWLPTSLHMTWNLSQGFIYGFPVSGIQFPHSLLQITSDGRTWVTGGSYGPEGGALTICVLIPATIYILYSRRVRPSAKAQALWEIGDAPLLK